MTTAENISTLTGEAGTAILIYRFVVLAADGQYDHVGTDDALADGVSAQAQATVGGQFAFAEIGKGGLMKVEAGEAVSVGDLIGSDTVGRAKTGAAGGAAIHVLGRARTAASAAGEIIQVQLIGPYNNAAS